MIHSVDNLEVNVIVLISAPVVAMNYRVRIGYRLIIYCPSSFSDMLQQDLTFQVIRNLECPATETITTLCKYR